MIDHEHENHMKAYSVRVSDALFAELQQEARRRRLSLSAVVCARLTASFAASPASPRIRAPRLEQAPESAS
jgi:hypothetical protein